MESSRSRRSGLLTAGGVLSIVAGISQLISGGVLIIDYLVSYQHWGWLTRWLFLPFFPDGLRYYVLWGGGAIPGSMNYVPARWLIVGGSLAALGILAVVGGISALRRRSYGLSLAGAICALAELLLGTLAIVFVSLSRREFEGQK